jgi:hypothetical protein
MADSPLRPSDLGPGGRYAAATGASAAAHISSSGDSAFAAFRGGGGGGTVAASVMPRGAVSWLAAAQRSAHAQRHNGRRTHTNTKVSGVFGLG